MHPLQSLQQLLLLLPLTTTLILGAAKVYDDEASLLAFKAAATTGGYGHTLASWNSSSASGFCGWEGVTCGRRHQRVVALSLASCGLTGVLSPTIGNLTFLRFLNLSFNSFNGDIPASLGRLSHLQTLDLSNNAFSGELPTNLSSCTSLRVMRLGFNQLHGRVPSALGEKLARLEVLKLDNNSLTGAIPVTLANLSSLNSLTLSFNYLEGTIPPGLGSILALHNLDLSLNNLSGEPPRSLYNLSSLESLQLQENSFHGAIPSDIGSKFPSIKVLTIAANQFTGSIPDSISNLTSLQLLELSLNGLSGYVPHTLGRLQELETLYLYGNMLEADNRKGWEFIISLSNCSKLCELNIAKNTALTGKMPFSIVNLSTNLQILNLYQTGISGSIPSAISNLVSLSKLDARTTPISGVIPDSIGKLGDLVQLFLHNTYVSGLIPLSVGNLSKLTVLTLDNASVEGAIPASLGKLENLVYLSLSINNLSGLIPSEIFKPLLSISYLDLSQNSLSGPLPSEVGRLGNLNSLNLSGNQLSGEIPDSIGNCTVLQELLLDNNSFKGSIPPSLSNIRGLTALNLSANKLSGTIPEDIATAPNLQRLDVSFNNLQGEVPKEGIFRNLSMFSILGNNKLCGGMPQLHLAPCQSNAVKNNRKQQLKLLIALSTTGTLLFFASIIASIQLNLIRKKLKRKQKKPFLPTDIEEHYERVSYHALATGTNGFSEANLLGKGSFGAVYKCTFQDEGNIAAVKVFNLEQSGSTRSFVAECEALKRARHRCLIKILTCCSSINNQGQEFKALVFEFMPNGSLNDWLHPKSDLPTPHNTLSLEQRLDIAVDTMDALDYLHNHCKPPISHCDLKPSNIFLAEDLNAKLGDFGMSRILLESASNTLHNSNSTFRIRGTIGYVAPEYGEGSPLSTLGDVYSLGILLLEMFTGRSPTDDMFSGSQDLQKFSEDALPERIWEIADTTMWLHINAYDGTTRSNIEDCLVSVIALGISCSKKQPRERTTIQDAATEMHAIRDSCLMFARSLAVEHGGVARL
ncbi:hypothetical protein EJB05_50960, partial [Eragrostis curvula]